MESYPIAVCGGKNNLAQNDEMEEGCKVSNLSRKKVTNKQKTLQVSFGCSGTSKNNVDCVFGGANQVAAFCVRKRAKFSQKK